MTSPRPLIVFLMLGLAFLVGGCASSKKKDYPITAARFLLEAGPNEEGGTVRLPRSGTVVRVAPKSEFTEYDIQRCTVVENELGKSLIFELTPQAGRDLYRMTTTNQGKRLVTLINGRALGARRLDGPLNQGYILTYVEVDDDALEQLADYITKTSVDLRKEIEKKTR